MSGTKRSTEGLPLCAVCKRPMRPQRTRPGEWDGETIGRASQGLCATHYAAAAKAGRAAESQNPPPPLVAEAPVHEHAAHIATIARRRLSPEDTKRVMQMMQLIPTEEQVLP